MAKIPTKAADIAALSKRVVTAWANNSDLTLKWITQTEAATKVNTYNDLILQSSQSKNTGRATASNLRVLDKQIDKNLDNLKKLIQLEHGKENLSLHYAEYGIEYQRNKYILPIDRDARLQALRVLIAKLATASFKTHPYGEAFWSDILTQYETLKAQRERQVGAVSSSVNDKKVLKGELRLLLNCIKKLIEANYPTNASAVFRAWGFQDERN